MSASLAFHAFLPRELVQSDHEKQPPIVRFWSCELGPKARYDRAARNLWTQGGTTAKVWGLCLVRRFPYPSILLNQKKN